MALIVNNFIHGCKNKLIVKNFPHRHAVEVTNDTIVKTCKAFACKQVKANHLIYNNRRSVCYDNHSSVLYPYNVRYHMTWIHKASDGRSQLTIFPNKAQIIPTKRSVNNKHALERSVTI